MGDHHNPRLISSLTALILGLILSVVGVSAYGIETPIDYAPRTIIGVQNANSINSFSLDGTMQLANAVKTEISQNKAVSHIRIALWSEPNSDLVAFFLISVAVAVGAVLQTSTGMGFALIVVPMIGLIDLAYLPGPFLFANLILCLSIVLRECRALVLPELKPIAGGMIVGSSLGAILLTQFPNEQLGVLFGLFILGAVLLTSMSPKVPLITRNVLFGAIGSGFTGTAAAMHGPPLAMVYQHEKPEKARATLASAYVYGILLAFTTLHFTGRFGIAEMTKGLTLLPGAALGYVLGRLLVGRISRTAARWAMLTISAIGGSLLLAKSLHQIAGSQL